MLHENLQTAVDLQLWQNYTPLQVMFKDGITIVSFILFIFVKFSNISFQVTFPSDYCRTVLYGLKSIVMHRYLQDTNQ